jgi:selenocysteine lyase/cysteine desulfurase
MSIESLVAKSEFMGLESVAHLAAGGETPALRSHDDAAHRFFADKSDGMTGRARLFETVRRAKAGVAGLLDAEAADVGFLASASEGLFVAMNGIDWRPGDNVVVEAAEFPSVLHAPCPPGGPQVEQRRVGDTACPSHEALIGAVDRHTRAIAVSHVSYLTGARHDLGALRAAADAVGARLIVDASHALGAVPVPGRLCDVVVSCAYKFLLGVHGVGVFYVNQERWPTLTPPWVGWHSILEEPDWRRRRGYRLHEDIRRFEIGNYPFLPVYVLENALRCIAAVGTVRIEAHVLALTARLRAGLDALGLPVLTPAPAAQRAANMCFAAENSEALEALLRREGVLSWSGDGRIRLSVHAYNDSGDVDRALAALERLRRQGELAA